MSSALFDGFTAFLTQAGALGLAAYAFVEALKGTVAPLGEAGMRHVRRLLGPEGRGALDALYGGDSDLLLKQAYRRSEEEALRFLRQGLNLALWELPPAQARQLLGRFTADPEGADRALQAFREAASRADRLATASADEALPVTPPSEAARRAMSLLDAALDARIRLGVARAYQARAAWLQIWAGIFALGVSLLLAHFQVDGVTWGKAVVVGLSAVPIAPIAKDLVAFLKAARAAYAAK